MHLFVYSGVLIVSFRYHCARSYSDNAIQLYNNAKKTITMRFFYILCMISLMCELLVFVSDTGPCFMMVGGDGCLELHMND